MSKQIDLTSEYQNRQAAASQLLAEIQALLAQHAQQQAAEPANWGYVGSVGHVVEVLAQVKEFLEQ